MRPSAYLTAGALLFGTALGAADFLLTDNERPGWGSNTFPAGEPRLKTGATLSVVTDGAFASSPEFAKTGPTGPSGRCWTGGADRRATVRDSAPGSRRPVLKVL